MDESTTASTPTAPPRRAAIRHLPLRHAVLEEVRLRITDGRYPQGSRLFEEEIAAELGVSRNPVREALQALNAEGFVELEPRRGARVAQVTAEHAAELFEVRGALEGLMARRAAERRTAEDLAELRRIVELGRAAAAAGDRAVLPALNTEFHDCLGAAARNELLMHTVQQLSHVIQWVYAGSIGRRGEDSWSEHASIVDAIGKGDADEAERCAAVHITNARDAYMHPPTTAAS